jgi:hypothetical protein
MATTYIPVSCRCYKCFSMFIEWFYHSEVAGRTKHWKPRIQCNRCYCEKSPPGRREKVLRQLNKRILDMFDRFPDADTKFLDALHAELFKNPELFRKAYTPVDTSLPHTS